MVHTTQSGRAGLVRIISLLALVLIFSFSVFGQQPSCTESSGSPTLHAEGLAEQLGNINLMCSGGSGTITTFLFVSLNANITNRLDANGNLTGITLTGASVPIPPPILYSPTSLYFGSVQLNGAAAQIVISGIRAAIPTATGGGNGTTPSITGALVANNLMLPASQTLFLGFAAPTLLSSVVNYGIPCLGSPLPTTFDFPDLIAAGTSASTIRITEASPSAFAAKTSGADFGVRFLVNISGYGPNAQVFVPDVIVGNRGTTPTAAGAFYSTANGGTYSPGVNQFLLTRVAGADATGAGGSLFLGAPPGGVTSFTSVTQLALVNGAASVTYEVLDANPGVIDWAQIPVFVGAPASSCSTALANTLGATLAPVSKVSVPTQSDPIPRYVASTPGSDCSIVGDCA